MKKASFITALFAAGSIIYYSCTGENNELIDSGQLNKADTLNYESLLKVGECVVDTVIGPAGNYNCFGFAFKACETGEYVQFDRETMDLLYFKSGLFKKGGNTPSKVLYWNDAINQGRPEKADHAAMITNDVSSEPIVRSKHGEAGKLKETCESNYYAENVYYKQEYSLDIDLSCPQIIIRGATFTISTRADGRSLGIYYSWGEYNHTAFELITDKGYSRTFKVRENAPIASYKFVLNASHQTEYTGVGADYEVHMKQLSSSAWIAVKAFSISISGPKCIPVNRTGTWTVIPEYGQAPYTYSWNCMLWEGARKTIITSTASSISVFCKAGNRITGNVTVTGSNGQTTSASVNVSGDCLPIE